MIVGGGFGYGRTIGAQGYGYGLGIHHGDGRHHKTGWEDYVAPRKTLKQYKEEYLELSYFEIEQEQEKVASEIKLAEQDIRFNVDLGLQDVIVRLKAVIQTEKMKLAALNWVVNERRLRAEKLARRKSLDADLVFIATYLMDEDDD